jgi:hypothetical protein
MIGHVTEDEKQDIPVLPSVRHVGQQMKNTHLGGEY